LNGANFFFFSKHVLSPESPGNRPHPQGGHYNFAVTPLVRITKIMLNIKNNILNQCFTRG
ncbi:hypothetical protein, partial [Escherichia coli]|uniref:hypothetical protein n=1 Tax=Escherichia coli TaxID=562 RepID=UPI001BDCE266